MVIPGAWSSGRWCKCVQNDWSSVGQTGCDGSQTECSEKNRLYQWRNVSLTIISIKVYIIRADTVSWTWGILQTV